ncbi:dermonecrotic toxin domain-containing protein [Pseudomonas atagonensis]|uniref:dermonecrotic toxin domain-containing protein n=1 Tax=Pseudomonas atagonensis TaxID=2609964 RepID=UPI001FED1638|nr:DUF6543 domain-containing protein [Pseudomonas atagonensis]
MNPQNPERTAARTDLSLALHDDAHYLHLHHNTPDWLAQAKPHRREALKRTPVQIRDWYKSASRAHHEQLQTLNAGHWKAQNHVENLLANLKDAKTFCEPLLVAAIKERFGLELNVTATFLRLYIPAENPWFGVKFGGKRVWDVSLLDAALHNFDQDETLEDAFEADSCFITQPSVQGQFEVFHTLKPKLPISAFVKLCRTLDLGEQYKAHLESELGVHSPERAAALKDRVNASQKAALVAALQYARMKNELREDLFILISGLVDGLQGMRLDGQALRCYELAMLASKLCGILLFTTDLENSERPARLVAYVPNDPLHPVKEYASSLAFVQELTRQLRQPDYQQFFSRFIVHKERGRFFATLNSRLVEMRRHPHERGDAQAVWRPTPIEKPKLDISTSTIQEELWAQQFLTAMNKILNDASTLAVPTAVADQQARWALWDTFAQIATTLLTVAAFIAAPFVPLLGEVMLGYMAYQTLNETFEGVIDWAEGHATQAFLHFMEVVESVVQLGTFAAGGAIVAGEFRNVLPNHVVAFIDRFKPVKTASGKTLYWKLDLAPYEQKASLPKDPPRSLEGLIQQNGKTLLPLEDKLYAVKPKEEPGHYSIEHPTRGDAYLPEAQHFNDGTWQTAIDQPLRWDKYRMLRRIGHSVENLSATELEQALEISGYHEDALRKMHVEREPLPPLLADTLKRYTVDKQLKTFIEQMSGTEPQAWLKADHPTQLRLLTERCLWPEKALRLLDKQGNIIWQTPRREAPTINLDQERLEDNDLLKTVLGKLDESERKRLLEEDTGAPPTALDVRTRILRKKLAGIAGQLRSTLFDERYRALEKSPDANTQKIIDTAPGLPTSAAEEVLRAASGSELQQLESGVVPQRLKNLARWALQAVRVNRAYEGLHLDSISNPDTTRLALHSLEHIKGWPKDLRIEIRDYSSNGTLRDSIGSPEAGTRKILVLREDGQFEAFDDREQALAGAQDFYQSILQALPDDAREWLNIHIGQGTTLKNTVRRHALPRDELRKILAEHPLLKPAYDPRLMRLPGGSDGYRLMPSDTPTLEQRARALNPSLNDEELASFVRRLQNHPDGPRHELTRLQAEFLRLDKTLRDWIDQTPQYHPQTGARLTPASLREAKNNRLQFKVQLQLCWRDQTLPLEQMPDGESVLRFTRPLIGDLPEITASFRHISHLSIEGSDAVSGMGRFLEHFPQLERLELRKVRLGHFPDAISAMPRLNELILSECGVRLTEQNARALAQNSKLLTLDLFSNPLGHTPDFAALPELIYLDLADTGITELPPSVLKHPALRTAIFNNNQISEIPLDFFKLPISTTEGFDFASNPLNAATRERVKLHFQQTSQDLGVLAPAADLQRAQALYPVMLQNIELASDFVYSLSGDLAAGRVELVRLQTEYDTLRTDLAAWTGNIPAVNLLTGAPFTDFELAEEHAVRDEFKALIEQCWRRESELDGFNSALAPTYELNLATPIVGELPALSADFRHVSLLSIVSEDGVTSGVSRFLENFPDLQALTVRECSLGSLPEAIFKMGDLRSLVLTECDISLTPESIAGLSELVRLDILDLGYNPLGSTPDVSQMTELSTLMLNHTGITQLPKGLFQLHGLDVADLNDNAIIEMPMDVLEAPVDIAQSINFRANPFNAQSLKILTDYFNKTGVDFGVDAVTESEEMEMSDIEGSEPEE